MPCSFLESSQETSSFSKLAAGKGIKDGHTLYFRLTATICSSGYFAELIKEEYQDRIQVTAIDPSEDAISKPKAKTAGNVDYRQATLADLNSEDQLYVVILFTKSLHHVASLEEVRNLEYARLKTISESIPHGRL